MATTTLRSDLRTRIRDYMYESTADMFTDAQLNRFITEEVNSLPSKDVYLEDVYTASLVANQVSYSLPTGTIKVEALDTNEGTTTTPDWRPLKGWDVYDDAIYFDWVPSTADTMRVKIKKAFTAPTGDVVALDVPDDKCELVVWGVVVRCYQAMMGYLRQSKNWDAISKPGSVNISTVQSWLRDAKAHYKELIQQYMTVPSPRDIDLVT